MDPRVAEYLAKCEQEKQQKDAEWRLKVMRAAGLTYEVKVECSAEEYQRAPFSSTSYEWQDGVCHYYIFHEMLVNVTDEEFAAIEKTITTKEKEEKQLPQKELEEEKSSAANYFIVLALILWIGGLVVSAIMANQEVQHVTTTSYGTTKINTTTEFSFTVFMSTYAIYAVSGALCLAASELFKKLQTIVNLLRKRP